MLADDLSQAQICERHGLLYAAGLADGYAWFQWSQDGGATKAAFSDGTTSQLVSPDFVDDEQPAIEVLQTGEIVVALTQVGQVYLHRTRDQGEHWEPAGEVE